MAQMFVMRFLTQTEANLLTEVTALIVRKTFDNHTVEFAK